MKSTESIVHLLERYGISTLEVLGVVTLASLPFVLLLFWNSRVNDISVDGANIWIFTDIDEDE